MDPEDGDIETEVEAVEEEETHNNTYVIRPNFMSKFRKARAEEIIKETLEEKLKDAKYHAENTSQWTTQIANDVKNKMKEMKLERYKYVVQVVMGEQRGEGVNMGARCFWDSDCDKYAQSTFMNDSLFCVCAVFGVYFY